MNWENTATPRPPKIKINGRGEIKIVNFKLGVWQCGQGFENSRCVRQDAWALGKSETRLMSLRSLSEFALYTRPSHWHHRFDVKCKATVCANV